MQYINYTAITLVTCFYSIKQFQNYQNIAIDFHFNVIVKISPIFFPYCIDTVILSLS